MKDISIKSVIRKTHSAIIGFFIILILSLCIAFIGLQHGIKINDLKLPHLKIEQLYIKWDKGLILTVDKVTFAKKNSTDTTTTRYPRELFLVLKYSNQLSDLIKQVDIKHLVFNDLTATFRYKIGQKSFLDARSNVIHFHSNIDADQNRTIIKIDQFTDTKRKIDANGTIVLNRHDRTMQSHLNLNFNSNTTASLDIHLKKELLHYSLHCDQDIPHLQQILKRFPIPQYIQPWIFDAINVKSVKINQLQGDIDLNDPNTIIKNISLIANFNKLTYTFDKNLPPIVSSSTLLMIQQGIISIYPKKATFSGQALQDSWLDIDLLSQHTKLTVHLISDLKLNGDLKGLLDYYGIKLPFTQITSSTKTFLNIILNLHDNHVDANGTLRVHNSLFSYNGAKINAQNGIIQLDNSKINIKKLTLTRNNEVNISIAGNIDVLNHKADLLFSPNMLKLGSGSNNTLKLKTIKKPLQYKESSFQSKLYIPSSTWLYDGQIINVNKLTCDFDRTTKILQIPKTNIKSSDIKAQLSGIINLMNLTSHLSAKISKFKYHDIQLAQRSFFLTITRQNHFILKTPNTTRWLIGQKELHLAPTTVHLTPEYIYLNNTDLTTTDGLSASLMAVYNKEKNSGDLFIDKLQLRNNLLDRLFSTKGILHLKLTKSDNKTILYSKELDSNISFNNKGFWLAHCNITSISKKITKLQDYHLTKGYLNISSRDNSEIDFSGTLDYPYSIFYKNNAPVYLYRFRGNYSNGITNLSVNNKVAVKIADNIRIKADHVGIDLSGIHALLKSSNFASKKDNHPLSVYIQANNSYLHLDKNITIPANKIDLLYLNSILTAKLTHAKGIANLRIDQKNNFYLYGTNFNDTFMNNLFTGSDFYGGELSFLIRGTPKQYQGIVEVKHSVLKHYALLNNILAFINTIPSLATFSLPGYSANGLATEDIYLGFEQKNNILHCKNIALTSKKLNIYGQGDVNLTDQTLDLNLNLKTNIASGVSKIPIVGYILFNKNSISTSLKVTGKVNDPSIQTSLAKDIVVAPVNIIKRTILSPLELLMPKKEFNKLTHF